MKKTLNRTSCRKHKPVKQDRDAQKMPCFAEELAEIEHDLQVVAKNCDLSGQMVFFKGKKKNMADVLADAIERIAKLRGG